MVSGEAANHRGGASRNPAGLCRMAKEAYDFNL